MASAQDELTIAVHGLWDQGFAEEPFLLVVEVRRPPEHRLSASLHLIESKDPDLRLDTTLFQPRVLVRPGETYRFVLPLTVRCPKTIRLDSLSLTYQVEGSGPGVPASVALGPVGGGGVVFQPSLRREIDIDVQSVCEYPHGTKVMLKLTHRRSTTFDDLQMNLEPIENVFAGKSMLRLPKFEPNKSESLELIVAGNELRVTLTAGVDGNRSLDRRTFPIVPPLAIEQKHFRFLEPRMLSHSQATIVQTIDSVDQAVPERDGVFVVSSGAEYRILVKPTSPRDVLDVSLEGYEAILRLRRADPPKDGVWSFSVSVNVDPLIRTPDRVSYEIRRPGGRSTDEIPLCIAPSWYRHGQAAAALGLALTVQGLGAAHRVLSLAHYSVFDAVSEFDVGKDLSLFGIVSIPAIYLALRLADWVQYQVRK